jgi:down-regulator of transcription 1
MESTPTVPPSFSPPGPKPDSGDEDGRSGNDKSTPNKAEALYLPRATMGKIIDELLPPGIACPKETRELLMNCCIEFIHLVTGEANELCETHGKKTISPEHVLEALKALGFSDYVEEAETARAEFEESQKQKREGRERNKTTLERSGLSETELQKQQEELFEAARQRYLSQMTNSTSPTPKTEENIKDKNSLESIELEFEDETDEIKSAAKNRDTIDTIDSTSGDEIKSGTKPLN